MAATVINGFQSELGKVAALAAFIPIIGSTGGNVGIQTSSLIVQSLSDTSGLNYSLSQRLLRTFVLAVLNGAVVGLMAGCYTLLIGEPRLFPVVGLSLLSVVLLASFMGTITPLLLDRIGINPAVASGPFITTANDLIGIGVYFTIANVLLAELSRRIFSSDTLRYIGRLVTSFHLTSSFLTRWRKTFSIGNEFYTLTS
jgi:magnesium transporter